MPENLSSALETFKQQRNAAEAHYLKANRVSVFFREYTAAVETLLAALWAEHFQNSALCLMAVGGFGRGEPYPCSDVDLAVVSPCPAFRRHSGTDCPIYPNSVGLQTNAVCKKRQR